ncbi:MAG TPA: NAD(P)-dependent oxidoreductase [Gammaproteobacteria bacterium]
MARPKVLIYRVVDESGRSHDELAAAGCEVVVAEQGARREHLLELARGAHVLLGSTFPAAGRIDAEFFAAAPELRIVSKYTIGVDDVDLAAASARAILVGYCPTEANWGGVAEGTLALLLALLKKVRERDRHVKQGGWRSPALQGVYLGARDDGYPGLTVGIVGLGRIGTRVAELLRPWRVRLLATDPYVDDERFARCGAQRVALGELLAAADVVTLHCNLTEETRGLIGAAELARMRPGAVLINTARGALLDLDALCDALESGRLAAAALDVFPKEPLPAGARIAALGDRVLLTPHMIAANQGGTLGPAVPWATAAALAALRGEVPQYVYNVEAVARWRERFGGRSLLERRDGEEHA